MSNHDELKRTGKYVVTYRDSVQISPDDFDVFTRSMPCDESTTVGEIARWFRAHFFRNGDTVPVAGVTLTESTTVEKKA